MKFNNNTEKITEQAFLRLIVTSVIGILLCMGCLCSATWAWFADDINIPKSQIQSAQGKLTISVTDDSQTEIALIDDTQTISLGDGEYLVTLLLPAGSASGYCTIKIGDTVYHSDYIERNTGTTPKTLSFKLVVPAPISTLAETEGQETQSTPPPTVSLDIESRWGIYSSADHIIQSGCTYLVNGESIDFMHEGGIEPDNESSSGGSSTETSPEAPDESTEESTPAVEPAESTEETPVSTEPTENTKE